jgi:phosphoglycerol transferase
MNIVVFFPLLYLFCFSIYKSEGVARTLNFLAQSVNIKHIALVSLLNGVILYIYASLKRRNILILYIAKNVPKSIAASLLIFSFLISVSFEFNEMYGTIPVEQIVFHLSLPVVSANFSMIKQIVVKPIIDSCVVTILFVYILSVKINVKGNIIFLPFSKFGKMVSAVAALIPVFGIICIIFTIGLPQYLFARKAESSAFYEENYISPSAFNVTFPEKKRNLIIIIAESLETGFLRIEEGGAFAEDLIPEIAALARNNINFSHNGGIGSAVQLYGTEWTIAGIVSYYSGVPLAIRFLNQTEWNNYGELGDEFLPGATGIGDILSKAGYKNYFILGSEVEFGGRNKYFKTHKDAAVFDYHYFCDNNIIPANYRVWWGIEDRKLYRFAKDIISDLSGEEPFFITLLTADTHPTGGYLDDQAERIFDSQYKNVLRDMSRQLAEFVEWIQSQDYYENTTVVILGDHLYQDSSFFPEQFRIQKLASRYEVEVFTKGTDSVYSRYPLNIFINSLLNPRQVKQRRFSHFDILPTLIESVGGVYEGEGLALGRSLNTADIVTLVEKYGEVAINDQLRRSSNFYNALWDAVR